MRHRVQAWRFAVAVVAAVPLVLAGAQAAQAGWGLESPATPPGAINPVFDQVSCPAPNDCVAVGQADSSGGLIPISERWVDGSWMLQSTPPPSGGTNLSLDSVSCALSSFCMEVGTNSFGALRNPLSERWNGHVWKAMSLPEPSGATETDVSSVSCASATSCLALGTVDTGSPASLGPFAVSWNGTEWTLLTAAFAPPGPTAVACPTTSFCEGVGPYGDGLLAESWNGSTWTAQSTPLPAGAKSGAFEDVWCGSATDCVAVGHYRAGRQLALTEFWNGSQWTQTSTPYVADLDLANLSSVSCISDRNCTAVGALTLTTDKGYSQTYAEHWNGTKWLVQPTAAPAGSINSALAGVSCHKGADCQAVGEYIATKHDILLIEENN